MAQTILIKIINYTVTAVLIYFVYQETGVATTIFAILVVLSFEFNSYKRN